MTIKILENDQSKELFIVTPDVDYDITENIIKESEFSKLIDKNRCIKKQVHFEHLQNFCYIESLINNRQHETLLIIEDHCILSVGQYYELMHLYQLATYKAYQHEKLEKRWQEFHIADEEFRCRYLNYKLKVS